MCASSETVTYVYFTLDILLYALQLHVKEVVHSSSQGSCHVQESLREAFRVNTLPQTIELQNQESVINHMCQCQHK